MGENGVISAGLGSCIFALENRGHKLQILKESLIPGKSLGTGRHSTGTL